VDDSCLPAPTDGPVRWPAVPMGAHRQVRRCPPEPSGAGWRLVQRGAATRDPDWPSHRSPAASRQAPRPARPARPGPPPGVA